jgi:hypothetical protein
MNDHIEIMLEALWDYRKWYDDPYIDTVSTEEDLTKLSQIDNAIEYLNKIPSNGA